MEVIFFFELVVTTYRLHDVKQETTISIFSDVETSTQEFSISHLLSLLSIMYLVFIKLFLHKNCGT